MYVLCQCSCKLIASVLQERQRAISSESHFACRLPSFRYQSCRPYSLHRRKPAPRCFLYHGDGAEDLLQVLIRCLALEELNFHWCRQIPGAAWAKLQGADWPKMRRPEFSQCFEDHGHGAADLLQLLGRSPALEELNFDRCKQIPGAAWAKLQGAEWPKLRTANFSSCFEDHGDGAADLLQLLSRCPTLEELNFLGCKQISGIAWAKLQGAEWPKMRKANFIACFEDHGHGAADLLQLLGRSPALEELNFDRCKQIPGAAWAKLQGAEWPKLRTANFSSCFADHGDGTDDLLQLLGRCPAIEMLDFEHCEQIPASAWQRLPDGCWPKLGRDWYSCLGIPNEQLPRLCG
eukprot:Skav201525  [mRNA]  locus=scaffold3018:17339:23195:+ [translate_table: standard]